MNPSVSDYLTKRITIAEVDEHDTIKGEIERWEAHEKGILHRAFTVGVMIGDRIICQHRKHPVFNDVFDLTASSHPKYIDGTLQTNEEAVRETLLREWNLNESEIFNLENKGSVVYTSKDKYSKYIEHEYCHLYICSVEKIPAFNQECAYGFSMQKIQDLHNKNSRFYGYLASWVQEFLQKGLL